MKAWMYRWLPIIFGCHQRADRSFFYHGKQFPICARCTGELIGILGGLFLYPFWHPDWRIALLLMLPLIIDGFTQSLTSYESNNGKRLLTGILFGYALAVLFLMSTVWTAMQGFSYGKSLRK